MDKESDSNTERTYPTYTRLRGVSWYAHQLAQRPDEVNEQLSNCMTSMLFSAFCLEAFLNHVGQEKVAFWDVLKEKLSAREKLDVLAEVIEFSPDFGIRPYQTFTLIIKLRNLLVHAKTETIIDEGEFITNSGDSHTSLYTKWEQYISLENATRFLEDTKAIIIDLCNRAGLPEEEIFATEIIQINSEKTIHYHISGFASS